MIERNAGVRAGFGTRRRVSTAEWLVDRAFRGASATTAVAVLATLAWVVWEVGHAAAPAIREFGWDFLRGATWDPVRNQYGVRPAIWGTLYSSLWAVAAAVPFGIAIGIFLTERIVPTPIRTLLGRLIELLAAIPSVVYGLWGILVVVPLLQGPSRWVHGHLGWLPLFDTPPRGVGMLPAALVLAIMILPTIAVLTRDALNAVPRNLKEAAYGLGATRWETILMVSLPTATGGIFGAVVLAFGRAVGETMAVAMLIGNTHEARWSLFSPAYTLAALLANQFAEAVDLEKGALMYAALVLLALALITNVLGSLIIGRASATLRGLS
jgi:phosphate transport system permease protein